MAAELPSSVVDTHCHLLALNQRGVLEEALASAAEFGVTQIVTVGLNAEDSRGNRDIADRIPGVFFSVGWHPHEKVAPGEAERRQLARLLEHPLAVAVGEIGLDCYWRPGYHEVPIDVQRESLRTMMQLADEHNKPVIIHNRDAHDLIEAELQAWPRVRGVMHCFSGGWDFAQRCLELGYLVSFAGPVTYKRNQDLREVARRVSGAGYVVETDAPFLPPVPHRGKTNLPGYVWRTVEKLAELRDESEHHVAAMSTRNARELFQLPADRRLGSG